MNDRHTTLLIILTSLVGWSVGTFISAFWESPSLCTFCGGISIISGTLSSTTFCHCTFRDRLECVSSSPSRNAPAIPYCQIWSLLSFFLPSRTAVSLHNRNEPSTQHPSTKTPSSRSSEHHCNATHQRQLIVSKPQSLCLQPTRHHHHHQVTPSSSQSAVHYRNTTHERLLIVSKPQVALSPT